MKLKSLYNFLRVYFNYATTGNKNYARSVLEAMEVIRDTSSKKTLSPIQIYLHKPFARTLTKAMLQRLVALAMSEYQNPFIELQYFNIIAAIDKSLITTNHRGIYIPIEGVWDNKNNKLIIFTFSKPSNMREEVRVIKGLLKEFVVQGTSLATIKTAAYWDLSKGKKTEIDYEPLKPVDRQSLIDAANKIK